MRVVIIYLTSLLLMPALVVAKRESPSRRLPSPPPRNSPSTSPLSLLSASGPEHGDFVRYRTNHGEHVGIVVGEQHLFGNINIAPLAPHSARPPQRPVIPLHDHVVSAHSAQVANTGHSSPDLATQVERQHENNHLRISHASGAVEGSPIRQAMQILHRNRPGGNRQ